MDNIFSKIVKAGNDRIMDKSGNNRRVDKIVNDRILDKVGNDRIVDMVENDIFASLLYYSLFLSPWDAIPFQNVYVQPQSRSLQRSIYTGGL